MAPHVTTATEGGSHALAPSLTAPISGGFHAPASFLVPALASPVRSGPYA
jgi:hypothetical protein